MEAPKSDRNLFPPSAQPAGPPSSSAAVTAQPPDSAKPPPIGSHLHRYIPKELLGKLEAARAGGGMVGERRIVTMLFCDLKGSTAAAEQLDPEDWSEIINGAFEFMIQPVYRYEGMVARLMGDGILAFFGAPIAHEDDPQRAILAGLAIVANIQPYRKQIQQRYGVDFDVRVGINTGLVVVGAVGSDLRMEYSAVGDAINLASRMEQTAEPGTVQIAGDTYRLVKGLFDFEALGNIEVKGKHEPVQAYRVLRRRQLTGRKRGVEGLYAEMVGRESELLTLRNVVTALKQGVGRIVCVLGEAGLGKTRLVSESCELFKELIGDQGNWHETTSLSYETNQAYGLFQRLIRRVIGINYDDGPELVREKLGSLVDRLPEARQARATIIFEALFGLENSSGQPALEGDTFRRELYELMRDWWQFRFAARPTVLVFDDMHWSDSASIQLLRQLLPLTEEIPLVLLCAMRSERQMPAWQIKKVADEEYRHRYTEVFLAPLSDAETNELVNRLLAPAELPDLLRASILEKSAGNPFFVEEVVRTLIDSGVVVSEEREVNGETRQVWRARGEAADFDIPDNLQSLLAARIDRLEESARATLQIASVIGRSFYRRVLECVDEASQELDKHLETLVRLDMIREAARLPEVEYTFRNPLTQEAVYKTILLKRRRAFHARVAEAMEALYADRIDGLLGMLAYHFAQAGRRSEAIGYYRGAARKAIAVYGYEEALQSLQTALDLLEPGDQSATHLELLEEMGNVCWLIRDFQRAISLYQQGLTLWRSLPDADKITAVRLHRQIIQIITDAKWAVDAATYEQVSRIRDESRASLEENLRTVADEPPHPETVHLLVALSVDAWRVQDPPDWESAQRSAEQAVAMADQLDDPRVLSRALGALANVLDGRSLLRDHLEIALRRLAVSQRPEFDDFREKIDTLRGVGVAHMYVGEYREALPHLAQAVELAAQVQATDQIANALGIQAQSLFRMDLWDEVLEVEKKWRLLEQRFARERVGETCFFVALSASIHALRGDYVQANLYARESYDYMIAMSGEPDHWQRNQFY